MSITSKRLYLTACRTGKTVILGKYQFVDGMTIVKSDEKKINGLITYLGRTYKAFPEGSEELSKAKEDWNRYLKSLEVKSNGPSEVHKVAESGDSEEIPSGLLAGGGESEKVSSDNGAGSSGTEDGNKGLRTDGNGPEKVGLEEAIHSLDPKNDEHWTQNGRPRIDALSSLTGRYDITKAEIDSAAPGFIRPEAF